MEDLKDKLAQCELAKAKAESEIKAVRTKLHSAVRKGKAIEAERGQLQEKLQASADKLARAEEARKCQNEEFMRKEEALKLEVQAVKSALYQSMPDSEKGGVKQKITEGQAEKANEPASENAQEQEENKGLANEYENMRKLLKETEEAQHAAQSNFLTTKLQLDEARQECSQLEELASAKEASKVERGPTEGESSDSTVKSQLEASLLEASQREQHLQQVALNLQIEVMSVREEREQAERDLEAQLEKLKAELTDTQQNADIMREALQAAAARIQEAQDSEAQAKAGADAAQARAESLDEEAAAARRQLAGLQGTLAGQQGLEAELEQFREEVGAFKAREDDLQAKLQEKDGALISSQKTCQDLQLRLTEADDDRRRDIKAMQLGCTSSTEQAEEATRRADHQLELARQKTEEADKRVAEAMRLQSEVQQQSAEAESRVGAAEEGMARLQEEEAARKQRFGFLQSTFAKEKAALQEELHRALDSHRIHQKAASCSEEAMASKDEALSRAYSQAEELKHTSESLQARIRQLEGKLAAGQQELRKNTEAIAGYRDTAAEAEGVARACGVTIQQLEEQVKTCEMQLLEARGKSETLSAQIRERHGELEGAREALQRAEDKNKILAPPSHTQEAFSTRITAQHDAGYADLERGDTLAHGHMAELEAVRAENAALQKSLTSMSRTNGKNRTTQVVRLERRIQEIEKQNQELHWQIAMLAKDPEGPTPQPKPQQQTLHAFQEATGGDLAPKLVGLVLRYRRALLMTYLGLIHVLLYILLQARGHHCSGSLEG